MSRTFVPTLKTDKNQNTKATIYLSAYNKRLTSWMAFRYLGEMSFKKRKKKEEKSSKRTNKTKQNENKLKKISTTFKQLCPLRMFVTKTQNEHSLGRETKLHQMMRFQFWSYVEWGAHIYGYNYQAHSEPER